MIQSQSEQARTHVVFLLKKYHEIKREVEQKKLDLELLEVCPDETDINRNTLLENVLLYESNRIHASDRENIEKTVKSGEIVLCKLEDAVSNLDDDVKHVIEDLYFLKLKWHQICSRRYISQNTLNRYRQRGINQLASLFATNMEEKREQIAGY